MKKYNYEGLEMKGHYQIEKFPVIAFTSLVIALSMVGYAIYMTVRYQDILNLIK